jgi:hypothetical protein
VVQKVSVDVPVMPAAPVLTLVLAVGEVQYLGPAPVPTSAAGASPPRRILLQSFQI